MNRSTAQFKKDKLIGRIVVKLPFFDVKSLRRLDASLEADLYGPRLSLVVPKPARRKAKPA